MGEFRISRLEFRICFGFRYSDFEFGSAFHAEHAMKDENESPLGVLRVLAREGASRKDAKIAKVNPIFSQTARAGKEG